jgi:hypothetical protein
MVLLKISVTINIVINALKGDSCQGSKDRSSRLGVRSPAFGFGLRRADIIGNKERNRIHSTALGVGGRNVAIIQNM